VRFFSTFLSLNWKRAQRMLNIALRILALYGCSLGSSSWNSSKVSCPVLRRALTWLECECCHCHGNDDDDLSYQKSTLFPLFFPLFPAHFRGAGLAALLIRRVCQRRNLIRLFAGESHINCKCQRR